MRYTVTFCLLALSLAACTNDAPQEPAPTAEPPAPAAAAPVAATDEQAADERPNILLILADDMGYSDIGRFGSEIATPNIDQLAAEGLTMTNFSVGPTCSPTRAMLYSGTDNHRNGLGTMNGMHTEDQLGQPGYEAYLNKHVVTFMTLLKDAGYHNYIAGKWQQGYEPGLYPLDRGFERGFWLLSGGGSHWNDRTGVNLADPVAHYFEDEEEVETLPEDFYSADYYTDKLIEYIGSNIDDGEPFFAMASYRAPHWPLHAPPEYIEKYAGVYDVGYEEIKAARTERQRELGILEPHQEPAPMHPEFTAWDDLADDVRQREIKRMQVYAAMVDNMDVNIGRLLDYLKEVGVYENTLILFMSDNGAEGNDPGMLNAEGNWRIEAFDNSLENIGRTGSYEIQGPGWASVSNTPFYLHKGLPTEGGISSPLIVVKNGLIEPGRQSDTFATVMDLMPTFLDITGVEHPGTEYKGRTIFPMTGTSMLPYLAGDQPSVHPEDFIYAGELWNRRVVRQGDWKLTWSNEPWGTGGWALYNLDQDIGEQVNLIDQEPERVAVMVDFWEEYVAQNGVIVNPDHSMRYSNENDYDKE